MTANVSGLAVRAVLELQMFKNLMKMNNEKNVETNNVQPHDGKPYVLRPCPFCGCENVELKQYAHNGWKVKCKRCLMGLKQKTLHYSMDWLKQQMIDAWNVRA